MSKESLLDSIKGKLAVTVKRDPSLDNRRPTIYRVPRSIKNDNNQKTYQPKFILIGPYNHYNRDVPRHDQYAAMERIKWQYLNHFLSRNTDPRGGCNGLLDEYLKEMEKMEQNVRSVYCDKVDIESDEFVLMMLLDGCFIVEFLLRWFLDDREGEGTEWEDLITGTKWGQHEILTDMLIVENQLPFFLVEMIYRFVHPEGNLCSLMSLCLLKCCVNLILYPQVNAVENVYIIDILDHYSSSKDSSTVHHFLHLCHTLVTRPPSTESRSDGKTKCELNFEAESKLQRVTSLLLGKMTHPGGKSRVYKKVKSLIDFLSTKVNSSQKSHDIIPSASMLRDAGVEFRAKKNPESILDVSFHDGVMEIPQLHFYGKTNCILRNLIAFEHCHPEIGSRLSAYCLFLDLLIDTNKDIVVLQESNIIMNHLSSNDYLAKITNKLGVGLSTNIQSSYLDDMFMRVNKYAGTSVHQWRAKLKRDYFSSPWAIISFVAAVFLMILTVVQTVIGIVPFVKELRSDTE